jgi:hypothetical protein
MKFLLILALVIPSLSFAKVLDFDQNSTPFEVLHKAYENSSPIKFNDLLKNKSPRAFKKTWEVNEETTLNEFYKWHFQSMSAYELKTEVTPQVPSKGPLFSGRAAGNENLRQISYCLSYDIECITPDKPFDQVFSERSTLEMITPSWVTSFRRFNKNTIIMKSIVRNGEGKGRVEYSYAWLDN